jgi:hypothetical protein
VSFDLEDDAPGSGRIIHHSSPLPEFCDYAVPEIIGVMIEMFFEESHCLKLIHKPHQVETEKNHRGRAGA